MKILNWFLAFVLLLITIKGAFALNETFETEIKIHTFYNSTEIILETESGNKTFNSGINSESTFNALLKREIPIFIDCNKTISKIGQI